MSNRYHLTQQELGELEYEPPYQRQVVCGSNQGRVPARQWLASRPSRAGADDRSGKCAQPSQTLPQRRTDGLAAHEASGSDRALNDEQRQQLTDSLQSHLCLTARQAAHYVQQTWQVTYSERGITQLKL